MRFSPIVLFLLLIWGCKKPPIDKTKAEFTSANDLISFFDEKKLDFETLEIKGKCDYQDAERKMGFNLIIRLKKDEKVWVSGRLFGIEGVRALITPDSVHVVNRLERTYISEPVSRLEEFTSINADFATLQSMIIGDILLDKKINSFSKVEGQFVISTDNNEYTQELYFDVIGELKQQWIYLKEDKIDMNLDYANYEKTEKGQIPTDLAIDYNGEERISIDLAYNQIKIDEELDFPLTIPRGYKRE